METRGMMCCGLVELAGLSGYRTPEAAFTDLIENNDMAYDIDDSTLGGGAAIFTSAGARATYGARFAKYIEDNKLGTVTELPRFKNPNTRNAIRTFFWVIDYKAVRKLYKKLHPEERRRPSSSYNNSDYYGSW